MSERKFVDILVMTAEVRKHFLLKNKLCKLESMNNVLKYFFHFCNVCNNVYVRDTFTSL